MFNHQALQNFMAKAYVIAARSPDKSNQNGAILVQREVNGELVERAKGHNHFYEGIPEEVDDRTKKMQRIEHAERDCIYAAAARGVECRGSILICPWTACRECARAIIGSEVHAVVFHKQRNAQTPDRWVADVNEALGWMEDKGIWLYEFDGPVPKAPAIKVNGELWSPAALQFATTEHTIG